MNPEATAGGASLEVLSGRLRVQVEGRPWEVGVGELIVLADNLRERVTAVDETAFLLTVAWPPGAGAWDQEMTGGSARAYTHGADADLDSVGSRSLLR